MKFIVALRIDLLSTGLIVGIPYKNRFNSFVASDKINRFHEEISQS